MILHEVILGVDYAKTAALVLIIIVSVTLIDPTPVRMHPWAT